MHPDDLSLYMTNKLSSTARDRVESKLRTWTAVIKEKLAQGITEATMRFKLNTPAHATPCWPHRNALSPSEPRLNPFCGRAFPQRDARQNPQATSAGGKRLTSETRGCWQR